MPDRMPEGMPDRIAEDMSDRMPEDLPVRKCINVMVGITRSKVILFVNPDCLLKWMYPKIVVPQKSSNSIEFPLQTILVYFHLRNIHMVFHKFGL
jgi:hypothetical protein